MGSQIGEKIGSDKLLRAYGEVVRVVPRGGKLAPGMAVRFRDMDGADRAALDAFLIARATAD